jgi:thioredoxin-dependent peroxiredoxin
VLKTSTQAPDFVATLDNGEEFRLSGLRGEKNVVLYFYPRDFSRGCTAQACSFRDNYAEIRSYNAVIIGVSGDSAESHRDFKETHSLEYPIISDADGRIRELYDVRSSIPVLRPRVTYVIDKSGMIRAAFRHDIAVGRHITDVLEALRQIEAAH